MTTIREALGTSAQFLSERGIPDAKRSAEDLLSHILSRAASEMHMYNEKVLSVGESSLFWELVKKRGEHIPLLHLLGRMEFYGNTIQVTSDVLIPRPETEILVDMAISELPEPPNVVLDLCTGSGCIALALKKVFPSSTVYGSDLSLEALKVANHNRMINNLDVHFIHGDFFEPFQGVKADAIFCNPPYISEEEFKSLDPSVRLYEPKMALVSGSSGLEFYERLAKELPKFLRSNSKVFLEIGHGMKQELFSIFCENHWKRVSCDKDWSGLDRFFFLEFE